MMSRIFWPRTPPLLLISSAASFSPCTVAWPNAASEPLVAAYTPTGISFAAASVCRSARGRQLRPRTVVTHTKIVIVRLIVFLIGPGVYQRKDSQLHAGQRHSARDRHRLQRRSLQGDGIQSSHPRKPP